VSACSTRSAGWSPRQDFNLHARRHSFLRRACLAIPSRGGAKRGDRTRHLLLVMQPAHHLPCFAFVHRQGVEPCCADLSGPATCLPVGRHAPPPFAEVNSAKLPPTRLVASAPRIVHRQGVEPCCADLSGPATYPRHGARVRRSGVEPVCQIDKTRLLTGGRRSGTAPRDRTELQCFVRARPAPAGERRAALGRGFEPR
jgi:hypothetical protein